MAERDLSVDERIKRAEEIYNRRNNARERNYSWAVSVSDKKDNKLMKKMLLQIFVCFLIYLIYYLCQNSTYIFSERFLEKTKEVLSYNVDLEGTYNKIKEYFDSSEIVPPSDEVESFEGNNAEETVDETAIEEVPLPDAANTVEETLSETEVVTEDVSSISQMQLDAEEIKSKVEMRVPVFGTVTSGFGIRESSEIVSGYHQGVDIAANLGTKIACGMEGDVTLVSEEGGYGKQIRITNGDILTIYGHCNSIYVAEGEHVNLGQKIGEVGETGNATGPHLHFEIRYQGRLVNPEEILGKL